ncbi:MAG: glycosyltransferase, partial [Flavobacteriaceae bacterium]|nr:glycosyltransferase [Flavobacteriaceae bacterium]
MHNEYKYINHYCLIDYSWDLWFKNQQKNQKHSLSFLQKVESIEYKKLNSAKHIFTTSKFIKDYIHSFYGIAQEKITNVGTGTGIIQPLFDKKRYDFKEILFVAKGRFIDKGGDLVIEVFKKLNIIDPTIRFTILGQDNYKDNFKKISNLNVLGYISQNELQNLFNRSTLFIMPAKNEP